MILRLISFLVIPACTLWFAGDGGWLTTNFSVLANNDGRQPRFILWGLIVGSYFYWCLRKIASEIPEYPRPLRTSTLALLLLLCALFTPYLPQQFPLLAKLHVASAFLSAVFLCISLLLIVLKLRRSYPDSFRSYLWGISAAALVCLYLFCVTGIINSALEVFLIVSADLMVYRLYQRVVK